MNIATIVYAFWLFELVKIDVECTHWVDDLTGYIAEDLAVRQVVFLTNLGENETTTIPIIDDIYMRLAKKIPILIINIEKNPDETNDSPPNNDFEDSFGIGSAATLFLLVHESHDNPHVLLSKRFVNALVNMATLHYSPKFLILFIGPKLNDSFEELLEYAWTKKLLDLTILEWTQSKGLRTLKTEGHQLNLPTIYQFNPFKNEYTKRGWTGRNVPLFPNKVENMSGYPLRITAVDSEPFTIAKFNKHGEPTTIDGANMALLYDIADRMNASLKFLPEVLIENPKELTNVEDLLHYKGELQRMDLHSYLLTRGIAAKCGSLRTASIKVAEFCAVVPILSAHRSPVLTHFISTYFLIILIILIFWIITHVLRFTSPVWRPLNVAHILIGASYSEPPHTNAERIMFVILFIISSIYSSSIYSAITNLSLETTGEMELKSIEDLDRSGLKPIINIHDFNTTFHAAENAMENLMKKTQIEKEDVNMMDCAKRAAVEQNIMCLMDKTRAEVAIARSKVGEEYTIKIAKFRLWSGNVGFITGKRCPYRSRIDEIIMRMHDVGLIDKLYTDTKIALNGGENAENNGKSHDQQSVTSICRQLMTVVIVGNIISLLAFIIEVVVYRKRKSVKMKKRRVVRIAFIV